MSTNKSGGILFKTQRSFSVPSTKESKPVQEIESKVQFHFLFTLFLILFNRIECSKLNFNSFQNRSARVSVSNENNVLLDPEVLTEFTQTLVLTVLATLIKYSTDENETRILYEYLAEASVVFPKVFPVM